MFVGNVIINSPAVPAVFEILGTHQNELNERDCEHASGASEHLRHCKGGGGYWGMQYVCHCPMPSYIVEYSHTFSATRGAREWPK